MKIKNHYIGLCIIWVAISILDSLVCALNFVKGNIGVAFIFLCISVGFSFVSGILFTKAKSISTYNHYLKMWEEEIQFLEQLKKLKEEELKTEPFKEFEVPFPEAKK